MRGRGKLGFVFWARCRVCERREDWIFVNIDIVTLIEIHVSSVSATSKLYHELPLCYPLHLG